MGNLFKYGELVVLVGGPFGLGKTKQLDEMSFMRDCSVVLRHDSKREELAVLRMFDGKLIYRPVWFFVPFGEFIKLHKG